MTLLLLAIPALTLAATVVGVRAERGDSEPEGAARLAARLTGWALGAAALVMLAVVVDGTVTALVSVGDTSVGLFADRFGALLLLLVLGVSAVVQHYASRYLRADPAGPRFVVATGALTTASVVLVTSASLTLLVVAWVAVGVAVTTALGLYRHLPLARDGVRRTRRAFLLGDAALMIAALVIIVRWGDQDLRDLTALGSDLEAEPFWAALVAVLVVVAALARSAQLPLPSWLPATLAAPTPVSALLHAGVVNAGGFLLIRLAPVFGASPVATYLAFAAGAATVVWGTVVMLTKPDIKGALAASTTAQMGFMVMTCGIGAYAAATVHLVAHGMYKASLFLGSGRAVHDHIRHHHAPPADNPSDGLASDGPARTRVAVAAIALPGASLAVAAVSAGVGSGEMALLLFAWATGAALAHGWLRRRGTSPAALAVLGAASLVLSFAYVSFVHALAVWLDAVLPSAPGSSVHPGLLVPVLVVLLGVAAVRAAPDGSPLSGLHRRLYVMALTGGPVRQERRALSFGVRRMVPRATPAPTAVGPVDREVPTSPLAPATEVRP